MTSPMEFRVRVAGRLRMALVVTAAVAVIGGCAATREAGKPFPAAERQKLVLDRTSKREA